MATQIEAKVMLPRVKAPSPVCINKVEAEAAISNTTKPTTPVKGRWLTKNTQHQIEAVVMQGHCTQCNFKANELPRTRLHSRQHYTLHLCKCQMFSPSGNAIYLIQKYGRCALQHTYVYEVEKDTYAEFCLLLGGPISLDLGCMCPPSGAPKQPALTLQVPTHSNFLPGIKYLRKQRQQLHHLA